MNDRGVVPKQAELDFKGLGQVIQFIAEADELKPSLPTPECFVDLEYLRRPGYSERLKKTTTLHLNTLRHRGLILSYTAGLVLFVRINILENFFPDRDMLLANQKN